VRLPFAHRLRLALPLALACSAAGTGTALAQASVATDAHPSFWRAGMGVVMTNWLTWSYNWYVQRWPWAKVGLHSWGRNFRQGFAWDNDCFLDNQLAHAYHGSLYLGSARASGYGFWASVPFVAAGSAGWEFLGENIRPSLNDLINTTLGGMAIGEVTYRLGSLVRSRSDGTRHGFDRQLASFAFNPVARAQDLIHRIPDETDVPSVSETGDPLGIAVGREDGRTVVALNVRYRDPFDADVHRPYDAFEFDLEVGPKGGPAFRRVAISGLLARGVVHASDRSQLLAGVFQHYDYEDLIVLQSGGQSFSGALLYRRRLGYRNRLDFEIHAEGVLLGAISSDEGYYWRRNYDLGSGAGARLRVAFARDGREWLRLDSRRIWLHSIHGSDGSHVATFLRLSAAVPLAGSFGIGGDLGTVIRRSSYPDLPGVVQRTPQLRAYLAWIPS
jgi:hypothetical protein